VAESLIVTGAFSIGVSHSDPISILDAVRVVDPSLTVSVKWVTTSTPACSPYPPGYEWVCAGAGQLSSNDVGEDALGQHYFTGPIGEVPDTVANTRGWPLQGIDSQGHVVTVAYLLSARCRGGVPCTNQDIFTYSSFGASKIILDIVRGTLTLGVYANYDNNDNTQAGILEVRGLSSLFDTLLTFIPPGQTLSMRTPVLPDGFRAADSLQVWTGNVRTLPDWSQAQPLACMAATSPAPGQLVSVADALPDPSAGEGRYYVVASQSGAQRRLGREYVNSGFSARDPAGLPVCQ